MKQCVVRHSIVSFLVAIASLFLVGMILLWPKNHQINMSNATEIEGGMLEKQVEELLGVPAGDYTSGAVYYPKNTMAMRDHPGEIKREWKADNGFVEIWFNKNRKVTDLEIYQPVLVRRVSFVDKMYRFFFH